MGFSVNTFLSTSQKALQEQYIKFVEGVITPQAQDLDNGKACLKEVMSKFAQAGYLGITIPKEFGGQGGTLLERHLPDVEVRLWPSKQLDSLWL